MFFIALEMPFNCNEINPTLALPNNSLKLFPRSSSPLTLSSISFGLSNRSALTSSSISFDLIELFLLLQTGVGELVRFGV